MKIAVASSGRWIESEVDPHAGRAACFIVYDTEDESHEVVENWRNERLPHWAGSSAMQALVDAGADAFVVRKIGPNAFRVVSEAAIDVYVAAEGRIVEAIRSLREGKLEKLDAPNCQGHPHLHGQ